MEQFLIMLSVARARALSLFLSPDEDVERFLLPTDNYYVIDLFYAPGLTKC